VDTILEEVAMSESGAQATGSESNFEGAPGVGDIIDIIGEIPGLVDPEDGVIVEVVNNTNMTLFRSSQSEDTSFKTLPQLSIPPGERDVFATGEETGSVLSGAEGSIVYHVGNPEATWTIQFENPNLIGDNAASSTLEGPQSGFYTPHEEIADVGGFAPARFTLFGEHPNPGTGGQQNEAKIVVINATAVELVRDEFDHTEGEFKGATPSPTVEPNGNTEFATGSDDENPEGAAGFVRYHLREDEPDFWWDVMWNVPVEGEVQAEVARHGGRADEFTAEATVVNPDPANLEIHFQLDQIADPVDPGGGGEPVEFEFPTEEADEPTLRHGMQGVDGWVEYMQRLLNMWGDGAVGEDGDLACPTLSSVGRIAEDGDFGNGTYQAVAAFQTDRGLMVDGICGNQTWSELKEEPPQPPSTDGREPGTYQEQGPEARWTTDEFAVRPNPPDDDPNAFVALAWNVGNVDLYPGDYQAYAHVTNLGTGASGERLLEVDSLDGVAQVGTQFGFIDRDFRDEFGPGRYQIRIVMPQDLGGDEADGEFEMPEN
jgi:peptidoglycan hydrolase-like protein with peptidoglycan-binding domain